MADVQFEEEQQYQQTGQVEQKSFLVRLVLSTGVVSSDRQAEYVLLGVAAIAIITAFAIPLFFGGNSGGKPPVPVVPMETANFQ